MPRSLRPARADDLGLRRALADRLLPLLVAAMTFLAALALAGSIAAAMLASHWRSGAASLVTVQVPSPDEATAGGARADVVGRILAATQGVAQAKRLQGPDVADLLRPWLGADPQSLSLKLPAMFEVRLSDAGVDADALAARLTAAAPGTLVERNGTWLTRLGDLIASLRACAALALGMVVIVSAAVVAIATRAGLAARRDAIEIVHGLGATDRLIAGQFARRITALVLAGSVLGLVLVLPVLLGLAVLAAPFGPGAAGNLTADELVKDLPPALWAGLGCLPVGATLIGWLTAQVTVRSWLVRLP